LKELAWLSPFDERDARRKQRADAPAQVLIAPVPNATLLGMLLCLPTAPALPTEDNGDLDTSPFFLGSSHAGKMLASDPVYTP